MLFDLRGSGRKRVVKGIYATLAVLMGSGLVLFGIGGATSGGLLDVFTGGGSGGGGGGSDLQAKQEKQAERRVRLNPSDAGAWGTLTRLHFQRATQGDNYNQATGEFKSGGVRELQQAATAWKQYVRLEKTPDPTLAAFVVQAYLRTGFKPPPEGVQAAEIVAGKQPSAQTFFNFAVLSYSAGQTRKGDLAAAKALEKTPAADRPSVKSQLDQIKKQGGLSKGSAGAAGASQSG
jgi:hypothetical protein